MKHILIIFLLLLFTSFGWSQGQLWKAMRTSKGQFTGGFQQGAMDDAVGASLKDAIYVMGGTDNYTVYNHMFVSYDEGVNWQQLPNAPWQERNAMGIAGNVNGKIRMWGGNSDTQEFRDAWEYDPRTGWTKIVDDMGELYGNRSSFAYVFTGSEFIVIGGRHFDNVIASNDLKTWTLRGLLPVEIQNTGGITACYFNGAIYLTSGRNRTTGVYPGKVYRSVDEGRTWNVVYEDTVAGTDIFSNKWGNIVATKTAMIYIKGTTGETGGTNEKGCYVSTDGSDWTRMTYEPSARHATTVFASTDGRDAYMVMGNFHNDSWLFRQIDDNTQAAILDSNCTYTIPVFTTNEDELQEPPVGSTLSVTPGDSVAVRIFDQSAGDPVLTHEFYLEFADTLSPIVEPLADTVLYLNKDCSIPLPDFTRQLVVKESCGAYTVSQTPAAGTRISGLSDSLMVQITIRDNAGNETQINFRLLVADTLHPEIENLSGVTLENETGLCGASADIGIPQVSGTCAAVQLKGERSDERELQEIFPVGETKIFWTAATAVGYTDTATQIVMVKDTEKPIVQVPAEIEFCPSANHRYELPAADVRDNCSVATITYQITGATKRTGSGADASGMFAEGKSQILWRATDASGNVSEAVTEVRVMPLIVFISAGPPLFPGADSNAIYLGYGPDSLLLSSSVQNGVAPFIYQWSSGDSTGEIQVRASAGSMKYSLALSDGRGCRDTADIFITVKDIRCGEKHDKVSLCWFENNRISSLCVDAGTAGELFSRGALPGVCSGNFPEITERYPSEEVENRLHIFAAPNPSEKDFVVKVESFDPAPVQLRLYNNVGVLISERKLLPGSTWHIGGNYPAGMYILQAQQGSGIKIKKLVKNSY